MNKLNIGVGGVPLSIKKPSTVQGISRVKELGLDLMEMEFVHGVRMSPESAVEVKKVREKEEIALTVHGPYYVNLATLDNRKLYGSIKYITDSIYIGGLAGAKSVTFHPAFYQGMSAKETYEKVRKAIGKIYDVFQDKKYSDHPINKREIFLAPELTGKPSQFGDLEELIQLSKDFSDFELRFCIDFAHKFARSNGNFNGYEDFVNIFETVERSLGKEFLKEMHMHVSAINYGEKGEKNHLTFLQDFEDYLSQGIDLPELKSHFKILEQKGKTSSGDFRWQELLTAIKDKNVGGYLVCESPILEMDALLLKKYYQQL